MPTSDNFDVHELSSGVYALIHKFGGKAICNAGLIDLGDSTIVFDTFLSLKAAEEIPSIVKQLELSPIKFVVNSHWHDDHIRGNQVFPKEVKIISTYRTAELIVKNEPENLAYQKKYAPAQLALYDSLLKNYVGDTSSRAYKKILMWQPYYHVLVEENHLIKTRLPEIFIEKENTIKGSKRSVKFFSKGSGHTESDLILFLPDEKIVFTGDLLFVDSHPYLADGSTDHLKEWLNFIDSLDAEIIIPGHGPIGDGQDLLLMTQYINSLEKIAANLIEKELTPDQAVIPETFKQWWFERFFGWNMAFIYNNKKETK